MEKIGHDTRRKLMNYYNGWMKKDSVKDYNVTKRFKGTADFTKERNVWCLRVTDTETKKVVEKIEAQARDVDTAIARAKDMAREWEKGDE